MSRGVAVVQVPRGPVKTRVRGAGLRLVGSFSIGRVRDSSIKKETLSTGSRPSPVTRVRCVLHYPCETKKNF